MHPGKKNSLDVLCERYEIKEKQNRIHHNALLDALLLAKVYIKMVSNTDHIKFVNNCKNKNYGEIKNKINIIKASKNDINKHYLLINNIKKNRAKY